MHFNGFPKEGLQFLDKIIINNSKEWLDANREEYEKVIVTPNKAYVKEMVSICKYLFPLSKPYQIQTNLSFVFIVMHVFI
jgi:uncharacterized protein (DUF2461 family)